MMHKTKLIVCLIISFISITYLISSSMASQKRLINFQGRLTDQQGNPLDGTYDIIFSIYASAMDMDPIWTEEHTNVSVSKGLVNVLLGSNTSFELPNRITFDESRYLGITIDCDHNPHTEEPEMLPRQQIMPAIYAYNADRLDGKDSSEYTTPQTDAGRPGVAEHLYEGSTRLVDKYATKEELDWNQLNNIPSGFADGTDHVSDDVSNPSGTYNSMSVGYASSAGSASSASNASAVNGLQLTNNSDYFYFCAFESGGGRYYQFALNWPVNWGQESCLNTVCTWARSYFTTGSAHYARWRKAGMREILSSRNCF